MHVQTMSRLVCAVFLILLLAARAQEAPSALKNGKALLAAGDYRGAVDAFTKAIAAAPDDSAGYQGRGQANAGLKDYANAFRDFDRAIELNPKSPGLFNQRGIAKKDSGDATGALADYNHAIELNPRYAPPLANRAFLRGRQGDADGALADYNQALEISPKDVFALQQRGVLKAGKGDYAGAAADYSAVIAINPKNAGVYYNRGLAREKLGNRTGALEDFQNALALDPKLTAAKGRVAVLQSPPIAQQAAAPANGSLAKSASGSVAGPAVAESPKGPASQSRRAPSKSEAITNGADASPSPTAATAISKAEPGYFKLVAIRIPNEDKNIPANVGSTDRIYGGQGTTSSYSFSYDLPHVHSSVTLKWSVPDTLVPGVPAKFRIAGEASSPGECHGWIEFDAGIRRILAGVRVINQPAAVYPAYPNPPPNVTADEFDLMIPKDYNQWKQAWDLYGSRGTSVFETAYVFRSADIDHIVRTNFNGGNFYSPQVPSDLKLEEVRFKSDIHYLSDPVKGPADIDVFVVSDYPETPFHNVARYTYRWAVGTGNVAANAELDAKPDYVEFLSKSGQSATLDVSVNNAGTEPWDFRAEYAAHDRPVARFQIKRTDAAHATLQLTEAGLDPRPDSGPEVVTLRIFAEQKGAAPLERDVKVSIGREGLYLDPKGKADDDLYHVTADGRKVSKEVDFRVMVWDPKSQRLVSNPELAQQLTFAPDPGQPAESLHALEVAGLSATSQIQKGGVRAANDPSGLYRFTAVREVPSNVPLMTARLRVTARLPSGKESSLVLPLGLETVTIGPESQDWQIEYDRCRDVINRFVPSQYWPKLNDILERRKMALGPKGLYALRHQLWDIAVNLTLHEGAQGWAKLEPWESRITSVLEWTEWSSKIAFDALAGVAVGPVYGAALTQTEELMKAGLVAWDQGELPDHFGDWFWNQTIGVMHLTLTTLSDPQALMQRFEANKAEAFCICVAYQFTYNVVFQKQTITDAAKNAIAFGLNQALAGWLTSKIMSHPKFLATMKVDVPRDETVLWSGAGGKVMAGQKGTLVNATQAGQWAEEHLALPGLDWETEAKPIWAQISRRYAASAKGKVTVYLDGGLKPEKIFAETELGAVLTNPDVTEITVFVREGGAWVQKNWFKPK